METNPKKLALVDHDTGLDTAYAIDKRTADNERHILEDGQSLQAMCGTPGWRLVSGFLDDMIRTYTDQLIVETKYDEVRRLQEHTKAYVKVQAFVNGKILEASELSREINEAANKPNGPDESGEPEENP